MTNADGRRGPVRTVREAASTLNAYLASPADDPSDHGRDGYVVTTDFEPWTHFLALGIATPTGTQQVCLNRTQLLRLAQTCLNAAMSM